MGDAIGPRTWLVGKILAALLSTPLDMDRDEIAVEAVRLADLTLDAMRWSDGKPQNKSGRVRSGRARMASMTSEQRHEMATKGAAARWQAHNKAIGVVLS